MIKNLTETYQLTAFMPENCNCRTTLLRLASAITKSSQRCARAAKNECED